MLFRSHQRASQLAPQRAGLVASDLIEALPAGSEERTELSLNVVRIPWQNLRPPLMHHIGAVGMAVAAVNAAPDLNEPFAEKFARSSHALAKTI